MSWRLIIFRNEEDEVFIGSLEGKKNSKWKEPKAKYKIKLQEEEELIDTKESGKIQILFGLPE